MKKVTLSLIMLCSSLFVYNYSISQSVTLSAALSLPVGYFSDDDPFDEDNGWAELGGALDFSLDFPVGKDMNIIGNVMWIYNPVNKSTLEELLEYEFDAEGAGVDWEIKKNYWMNIPIMGGIKYVPALSETTKGFIFAELGPNIVIPGNFEIEASHPDLTDDVTVEFDNKAKTTFGIGVGGGILFENGFSVGIKYLHLGTSEIESEVKVRGEGYTDDVDLGDKDQKIALVLFSIGYGF